MGEWKPEYEGFPRGFICWMRERRRKEFIVCSTLLIGGLALLVLSPVIALIFALLV